MDLCPKISGIVELEITSAEPEAMLRALNAARIEIRNIYKVSELTYRIRIQRRDYIQTKNICKERDEEAVCVGRYGLYWGVLRAVRHPILCIGVLLVFFSSMLLPSCILFVRIDGASSIPAQKIVEVAQECGIRFGASRRVVRSEQAKNALLSALPELQWAGVNTYGCTAVISVRERSKEDTGLESEGVVNIVATKDGHVFSVELGEGTALIQPGDTVQEGQTLISGYMDCGTHVRAVRAKGEIFAHTERIAAVVMPAEWHCRVLPTRVCKKISLLIGKKRINLWKDSGILDSRCGRMYEEYYVTLPGGFALPVALCVDSYSFYEVQPLAIQKDEAEQSLSDFVELYLKQQMIAGTICEGNHSVTDDTGVFCLRGIYVCREMIGKERQEKIGDTNGKNR